MTAGRYLEGVVLGVLCTAALIIGARRLRARFAPFYVGPAAHVADGVISVALLVLALEAVGVIGVLDLLGVVVGCVVVGGLASLVGGRGAPAPRERVAAVTGAAMGDLAGTHRRLVTSVALTGTSVVAAAWLGWTIYAYRHGMETIDTLWYHMPFAARFAQVHNIWHLQYVDAGPITVFYPATSELMHAFGILLFGRDVLSPVINLGWAGAALGCAWAVGRPWGREPHCVLACLPVLATPGLVDTQPGGAYNDIVCVALILASIALVVNAYPGPGSARLPLGAGGAAAAATGLALGVKFTMIGPSILLGLGTVVLLGSGQRRRQAGVWAVGMLLLGGYWYLRNTIAVGNPLPSLSLHLGPLSLPSPRGPRTYTVWQYLTSRTIWSDIFIPGLRQSLGLAWWALLLGAVAGAVVGLTAAKDRRLGLVGGISLISGFLFLVTPQLLGLPGDPIFFYANVRYVALPLVLGLLLLALAPWFGRGPALLAWLAATSLALLFTVLDPGVWASGFPVKPFADPIRGTSALVGALLAAAILVAGQAWVWRDRLWPGLAGRLRRRTWAVAGAAGLTTAAVLAGGLISASYARDRYRNTEPLPALYAWAQHVRHARIGIVGFNEQYPFTGGADSNHVQYIGESQPHGGFASPSSCRVWRTAINRGRYDFVVVTPAFFAPVQRAPELSWTQSSPKARPVVRQVDRGITLGIVFRISGRLDPAACPA